MQLRRSRPSNETGPGVYVITDGNVHRDEQEMELLGDFLRESALPRLPWKTREFPELGDLAEGKELQGWV